MKQTISEWKAEGKECLKEWEKLLNKNDSNRTDEDRQRMQYISDKFGELPDFKKVTNANYDARAIHPGFGSPDCYCHIDPPCQSCIDWTNCCDDRIEEIERGEPGCLPARHDCPIGRGEVRA